MGIGSIYQMYNINKYDTLIEDKRIVLLQSGGLDSSILASLFHKYKYDIHHLFVDYGFNSAVRDLENVKRIVNRYGGTLHIAKVDFPWLKECTHLVDGEVNDWDSENTPMNTYFEGVYVPMRNSFLLSIAWSLCESLKFPYIVAAFDGGENPITHKPLGGTSDKHPTFVQKITEALNEGSSEYHVNNNKIHLITPMMGLTKEHIIRMGEILGTDFSLSNSCYNGTHKACGRCSACRERLKAFNNVGIKDPCKYEKYLQIP